MIDIHSHILPGVDDGTDDRETAIAMLRQAAADGISATVATPHANMTYRFDFDRCREELVRLREAVSAPDLYLGCEVHLSPENVEAVLRAPHHYTLNGRDCLLVELPDQIHPPAAEVALEMLGESGLRLIVAHPERNSYLQRHPSYAGDLFKHGYFLQLTAHSLLGQFGNAARSTGEEFLRKHWVHLIASDSHNLTSRRQVLSGAYHQVERLCGRDTAELLFRRNPQAVLFGGDLSLPPSGCRRWTEKMPLFRTALSEKPLI